MKRIMSGSHTAVSVRIGPFLAALLFMACRGHEVTQPASRTPGRFLLIPLQGLSARALALAGVPRAAPPALDPASGSGFDLGTIRNTTSFYFLLRNGGETSITNVTLSSSTGAFQVTPPSIDIIPPDAGASLLQIIKVTAVHGTAASGIGFTALMPAGSNTTTLSIQGTTRNGHDAPTPVRLDANLSVMALLVDVSVLDGDSVVDLAHPAFHGLGANTCGVLVPGFGRITATLMLRNTGNVPLAVSVWSGTAGVPTRQTVAVGGSSAFSDTSELTVQLDGGGTISDHNRLPLTPCGTVILLFSRSAPPPPPRDSLIFITQPTTTPHGGIITPPVRVLVLKGVGGVDSSFANGVTISLGPDSTGAILSGTTSVVPVRGVATFGNLSVNLPGIYTLKASAPGAVTTTSAPFTVQ